MKRLALLFFASAALLPGCPLYPEGGCRVDGDCAPAYQCNAPLGQCVATAQTDLCTQPSDCAAGTTCAPGGRCRPGDCTFTGCVEGYLCTSTTGTWGCAEPPPGAAGAGGQPIEPPLTAGAPGQGGASALR